MIRIIEARFIIGNDLLVCQEPDMFTLK